jgi:hypothetical protein
MDIEETLPVLSFQGKPIGIVSVAIVPAPTNSASGSVTEDPTVHWQF